MASRRVVGAGLFVRAGTGTVVLKLASAMLYSQDSAIGKEIDGYHVLDVLGRGGMGVVYKAEDVALSRMVALKIIDPALAHDESFLRRFRSEARALARIDSPYIVSVHALRQTDFGVFIVMEYVDGGTVHDLRIPMPWRQALPIVKQMITALEHAHSVGVVHRDIKPRNIMLTKSGTVKVTDFGLAKLHQAEKQATVTQGIAGTLYYMSPEQVKGLASLDHRSDLYSLGMTMYEMLAGRLPFDKDASEFTTMRMIVEEKLPPPDQFRKDIPAPLVKIIMKSLEKDPAKRYQTAAEMLTAIEAFEVRYAGDAAPADDDATRTLTPPTTSQAGSRKRTRVAALAAAVVIALAGGGYAAFMQMGDESVEAPVQAALSVSTNPLGATVYLNDHHVGETPLREHPVAGGWVDVHVEMDGYVSRDTTLYAEAGQPLTLDLSLAQVQQDVADAGGQVTAPPSGTSSQRPPDSGGQTSTTPTPAAASLTLRTVGSGSVKLNGQPVSGTQSVRAGQPLRLTCGEGELAATQTVTLTANESRELTCYTEATVGINATGPNGSEFFGTIHINGQNTGDFTPLERTFKPGRYRVTVSRVGYVTPEEQVLEIRPGFQDPSTGLSFQLTKENGP